MYGYIQFLISSFYSRVIAIRSFLWLRLRQHPCEALLGEYVSLLSTYSSKFTYPIQISWQSRLSLTILNISFDVLIKRRNYASEKLKNRSISNSVPLGIMMRPIAFVSASWSSWGEWFLKHRIVVKQDPFRTDVASFFEPSVNCVVKAVLDQRKSAHKMISVSHVLSISSVMLLTISFRDLSMLFSLVALQRVIGSSTKYMKHWLHLG